MLRIFFATLVLIFLIVFTSLAQKRALDLKDCIEIAFENNLAIQNNELTVEDREIGLKQSRFSQLPNLNLGGNYGFNWGRSIDPTTNLFATQRIGFTGVNGNSNMALFNGLRIRNSIKQSEMDLKVAQFDLEAVKNDIALQVANAYLNVIFNEELVENAQYQIETTREQIKQTTKLVDAGALPIINQLNLESQLASDEVTLIQNENNYNLSMLNLKQLLLLPAEDSITIIRESIQLDNNPQLLVKPQALYQEAEQRMPEVQSAKFSIQREDLAYKIAQAARYPSLSVNAGFSTNYSSVADRQRQVFEGTETITQEIGFLTNDPTQTVSTIREVPNVVDVRPNFPLSDQFNENLSKTVSLNLSIPIFNRFQTEAGVQRSKLAQERAALNARQVSNELRQTIETAYNDALAASKSYAASLKQVEALEETFRVTQNQYDLGAINFTDYQVANNNLVRAKNDLIRAKYQYIFRLKILDFYQGKPLTND